MEIDENSHSSNPAEAEMERVHLILHGSRLKMYDAHGMPFLSELLTTPDQFAVLRVNTHFKRDTTRLSPTAIAHIMMSLRTRKFISGALCKADLTTL